MYFSVITPKEGYLRQAAYEMTQDGNLYQLHQWLWRFFPEHPDKRDFLFRRHEQGSETLPRFYVVSAEEPQTCSPAWQVQSKPYQPKLTVGERLRFELRANPVVAKKTPDGKTKRHDVVMEAKLRLLADQGADSWRHLPDDKKEPLYDVVQEAGAQWLKVRAEKNGFALSQLQVDAYLQHRAGRRDSRDIRFSTLDFSGELTVTDPALLQKVLVNGLGHAKAFGCGLLLIKRA